MKDLLLKAVRSLPIGAVRQEKWLFFLKLGYWPDFASPKSFNEKINHRKLFTDDSLLVSCTDKIAVRNHVEKRVGADCLVPLLYAGRSITPEQLHALGDNIVAKPSHDSKSTEIIRSNSPQIAAQVVSRLRTKLNTDFGKTTNQFAYSRITPRILVEKMLVEDGKITPDDYKVFCFRQPDGSTKMFIEVHQDRDQPSYQVAWYDQELQTIPMKGGIYRQRPFPYPEVWPRMRDMAEALARDFDHVRIDLYCVNKQIYFGEMTFFDGGGRTEYTRAGGKRNDFDREMGQLWTMAPPHQSETMNSPKTAIA